MIQKMREHSTRPGTGQAGQTIVLFALVIFGIFAFVALAVDGGKTLSERRITQNASDASALSGVHYMVSSNAPTEIELRKVVNQVVESNGIADTDGTSGNETNDNVTMYYTDDRGNRLETQPCYIVPCGSIPPPARGLEVHVDNEAPTFFLGIVGQDTLTVGANAIAVARGGNAPGVNLGDNALVAFGNCTNSGDRPLDMSSGNADVIGSIHGGTYFENRGSSNHYHGQVFYGENYIDTAAIPAIYEPDPPGGPMQKALSGDPFASLGLSVDEFNCTDGEFSQGLTCYDLTVHAPDYGGEINTRLLKQRSPNGPGGQPFLSNGVLLPGIYYGGPYPFRIGVPELRGTVTLVSENSIKITEPDVQLTGYMPSTSKIPGLLLYSTYRVPLPNAECVNFEEIQSNHLEPPINTTGNTGTIRPKVFHDRPGCVNLGNPAGCYELGSLQYNGLLYAPNGRVATSGLGATYVGAIVAYSIRVNGSLPRDGDKVGVLFVRDSHLFPVTEQRIFLDR